MNLAARFAPAGLVLLVGVLALRQYGTPVPVTFGYLVYLLAVVVLPGTLGWRGARKQRVSFVEDVAMGTALGLAVQVLLAFALAPLHLSSWTWVVAPLVIAASIALPGWRRAAWSKPGDGAASALPAWGTALAAIAAVVWLAADSFARNPVSYVDGSGPWSRAVPSAVYIDLPFHQAIAGGIDAHYPLIYPYLYDEPLNYHLFVYEHMAGASAAAGIDLTWLLYRLVPVALLCLSVVLVGVLARRLSGKGWAAPVASLIVVASSSANVYGWVEFPFQDPGFLNLTVFRSPTQTFGMALFLAACTAAVILLRAKERLRDNVPLLLAFALIAWGAGGSKSTFLPVLGAGLGLALVVAALVRRTQIRSIATLLGTCITGFVLLFVLVLGGRSGSLDITPFTTIHIFEATTAVADPASGWHTALIVVLVLPSWLCAGAGVLLLFRREILRDAAFWMLVGIVLAGIGGCLLTAAAGYSQLYFLHAAWPALGTLTAWGVVAATEAWPRWARLSLPVVVLAGMALVLLVRQFSGSESPVAVPAPAFPYRAMLGPWALFLGGALVFALVAMLGVRLYRRRWVSSGTSVASASVALVVFSLTLTGAAVVQRTEETVDAGLSVVRGDQEAGEGLANLIPREGALAALYVRDHSDIDDVVATNAHCYDPQGGCDKRHFWVSALTERRVLVEGWAYPEGFRPGQTRASPYWDVDRFDANEKVFADPDAAAVSRLANDWGVRWILVDRTLGFESSKLRDFATLVQESDEVAIYRID